ncbi:leucine-rich repeat domain-containing protein [Flammeovirga sp. SJP92]|uniref:leucine-rich repeat domain-containing protein n=1 Tax=Flammeovirga sp. SJP92 TaxID=1775430 RepID=UPI0007874BE0|nr:hypothetical protein [Flammeovirga sp. SJP92]KXX72465.1 hypothetical protein AVL50_02360 [Flammeovirga sp. SJP92]
MDEKQAIQALKDKNFEDFGYTLDENKEYVIKIRIEDSKDLSEFPEELKAFTKLERIWLLGCNIKEIPEFVTQFNSLKEISLSDNPIEELPEFLSEIKTLTDLNISSTNISKIPESYSEIPMVGIIIKDSKIEGFPPILYKWKNTLEALYLNPLDELPSDIGTFKKLNWLTAELNSFKYIDTIESMEWLKLYNSKAKYLPENFGNLKNLEDLDLRDCKNLVKLPNSIGNVKKFWGLMLDGCERLTALPRGIENVSIGVLDLSGCHQLRSVPKGLQVGTIRAENTKWKSMPSGIFFSEANTLWVTGHQISDITGIGNMYNLELCNLANGNIQKIPDGIGRLKTLSSLNLEHNKIKVIPPALKSCPNLKSIKLFGNPVFDMAEVDLLN